MKGDSGNPPCDMCGKKVQHSNHRYEGRMIPRYKLFVCQSCYDGNWDGWAPHSEGRLVAHLNAKGIPFLERNAKGLFPRGD